MTANMDPGVSKSYSFDVVIIGAGIVGLSTAKHFLHNSELSVAVVDASVPCAGATGAGQGGLWMIHRTPGTATWDLSMRSFQLWKMLADNLESQGVDAGKELGWKNTGSLLVGKTIEEAERLRKRVGTLCAAGLKAQFLSYRDLLLEEPELDLGPDGCAAFLPDDARIDNRETIAFIRKCNGKFTSDDRYVEFFDEPAVSLLRSSADGKIEAVQTSNNMLYAKKAVIVAAGCWTGSLMHKLTAETDVTVEFPVQPRKGYVLLLENFHEFLKLNHGVMEAGYANYEKTSTKLSKPDDDELDNSLSISLSATLDAKGNLVVGTSRQFVGFNTDLDMDVVRQILEHTQKFFPTLREMSLESLSKLSKNRIGFRPYMPGGKPVIGPIPSMPNVFLAAGHEGSGLLQSLGTAELIADMVLGNPFKVDPTPFAI